MYCVFALWYLCKSSFSPALTKCYGFAYIWHKSDEVDDHKDINILLSVLDKESVDLKVLVQSNIKLRNTAFHCMQSKEIIFNIYQLKKTRMMMMMVVVLNRTEYRECRLTLDQSVQPPAPPSVVAQHHHHHQDMVVAHHHHQWWYRCFSPQTAVSGYVYVYVEGKRNKITNIIKIIMVTPMYSNSPKGVCQHLITMKCHFQTLVKCLPKWIWRLSICEIGSRMT